MNSKDILCKTVMGVALSGLIGLLAACGGGSGSAAPTSTPKAWSTATTIATTIAPIAPSTDNARDPQIAFDTSGNALAVWTQLDGTRNDIWARRYIPGTGWGVTAVRIGNNLSAASSPQIAFDTSGNALAVWTQLGGDIWANRYIAGTGTGTGWGTAVVIDNRADAASSPQIAFDTNGNALAVWIQSDGTRDNIWAKRYIAGTGTGTGWAADAVLIGNTLGPASSPQIAVDTNGNALAVWTQSDGTQNNILANRYRFNSVWEGVVPIGNITGAASSPQIAFDTNGNALAVWTQLDGTRNDIWANRYTSSNVWGTAALIETNDTGNASTPQIAFDTSGNALAVWGQIGGTISSFKIWANRYTLNSGWGTAELIDAPSDGTASSPQIAFDASGNALAVWMQPDLGIDNIWANRYTRNTGWSTAVLIERNEGDAATPQIAVDTNGNALAVWRQTDGTRNNIWANRFQ